MSNYIISETIIDDILGTDYTDRFIFINKRYAYNEIIDDFTQLIKLIDECINHTDYPNNLYAITRQYNYTENNYMKNEKLNLSDLLNDCTPIVIIDDNSNLFTQMRWLNRLILSYFSFDSVYILQMDLCCAYCNCFYDKSIFISLPSNNLRVVKLMKPDMQLVCELDTPNFIFNDNFMITLFMHQVENLKSLSYCANSRDIYDQRLLLQHLKPSIVPLMNYIDTKSGEQLNGEKLNLEKLLHKLYVSADKNMTNIMLIHKHFQSYVDSAFLIKAYAQTLIDCALDKSKFLD